MHPLIKRPDGSSLASDKVKDKLHHLLRRADGTSLTSDRHRRGELVGWKICINKIADPWNMTHSTNHNRLTWWLADEIYSIYLKYPEYGKRRLARVSFEILNITLVISSVNSLLTKFKSGWIPIEDINWSKFKNQYDPLKSNI